MWHSIVQLSCSCVVDDWNESAISTIKPRSIVRICRLNNKSLVQFQFFCVSAAFLCGLIKQIKGMGGNADWDGGEGSLTSTAQQWTECIFSKKQKKSKVSYIVVIIDYIVATS